jgi:hypothetical protein
MAGFINNRNIWCIEKGNLQPDRHFECLIYTSLRDERKTAPVKAVRRVDALRHRDFTNTSVAYVYLHEGNETMLKTLAKILNGRRDYEIIIFAINNICDLKS